MICNGYNIDINKAGWAKKCQIHDRTYKELDHVLHRVPPCVFFGQSETFWNTPYPPVHIFSWNYPNFKLGSG